MGRRGSGSEEKGEGKRASLPQLMESGLGTEDVQRAAALIEEAVELKERLSEKVSDEEYDPKVHIKRRYEEIKEQLMEIQAEAGLEGLRHNDLVFTASIRSGRKRTDQQKFIMGMVERGVSVDIINLALNAATSEGESYWVREVEVI